VWVAYERLSVWIDECMVFLLNVLRFSCSSRESEHEPKFYDCLHANPRLVSEIAGEARRHVFWVDRW